LPEIFDLRQIRQAKVDRILRVMAFGEVKRLPAFQSIREIKRALRALDRGELYRPKLEAPAMPITEPERSAEAVRRALAELIKLDRYERRAAGRRARALRSFLRGESEKCKTNPIF
jgi:hypothetical protein